MILHQYDYIDICDSLLMYIIIMALF